MLLLGSMRQSAPKSMSTSCSIAGDDNVVRLDIPVQETLFVKCVSAGYKLLEPVKSKVLLKRSVLLNPLTQRQSFYLLGHHGVGFPAWLLF